MAKMGRPKGIAKTGGRKKGTKNKHTMNMKDAIVGAFEKAGGEDYLVKVAGSDPKTFLAFVSKVVPSEITANLNVDGNLIQTLLASRKRVKRDE